MSYKTLRHCVEDLRRAGQLLEIDEEVDPNLDAAEIHRRVYRSGGPAVYFSRVKGCRFPMVSNLFGTMERVRFMFRDSLERVKRLIDLKVDAANIWKRPRAYLGTPRSALHMLPKKTRRGPVLGESTTIGQLPQLVSWPDDGGPFITLPVVYSEHAERPGLGNSNLGMYRVQLAGGSYRRNEQIGLHYQIHRGIGVHHQAALRRREPFRVNIFVGGTPAMMVAAVMPLPEGMSELGFAGALAGHRIPMIHGQSPLPIYGEADFCITGTVDPEQLLPEGPFGDHLGYYAKVHDFPVLRVEQVFHRRNAIWPFTVVGRPPQEDTNFGQLIHEITGPVIPTVIPGVHGVNAVDAAGVHPLMLAIGSERYLPYEQTCKPREVLTQANAILGQGQMSLAKYLMIVARDDDRDLNVNDVSAFFSHLLCRVDWRRDLHFQTCTTIDTLDYSGTALNEGSKLVVAAVGAPCRELPNSLPSNLELPAGFGEPRVCLPGVLAVQAPTAQSSTKETLAQFCRFFGTESSVNKFPLVVLVDDSDFASRNVDNLVWVTFTRSNPAADIDGVGAFTHQKHWGCRGALVIDARRKPHHAPPLIEDAEVTKRVDALAARNRELGRWL